jgi:DNA-binding beta-propeller fold protein YncE
MRLWTLVCGLATTLVVSMGAQAGGPWLLTLNKTDLTMTIVDPATRQVVARLPSGPDPHEIVASPDGRLAYITNYTAGNGAENTISVIDLVARAPLAPIDLGSLSRPHGLHFAAGKLYFSAEGSKVVGRIDPATRKIEWVQGSGQSRTHMVLTTADGSRVFTTNIGSASVSIFEPAGGGRGAPARGGAPAAGAGRIGGPVEWNVFVVPVGRGAEGFDLTPDGKELWTANAQEASVSIVDVAARTATTIPVTFSAANRLKFTPDGKLALISDISGHELIVIDVATRKERTRIEVKAGASGTLITPDGARAYLSVGSQNAVAEIDLKSLTVTNWIATGRNPDGLAWADRVR